MCAFLSLLYFVLFCAFYHIYFVDIYLLCMTAMRLALNFGISLYEYTMPYYYATYILAYIAAFALRIISADFAARTQQASLYACVPISCLCFL